MSKPKGWKKINQGYRCLLCDFDLREEESIFQIKVKMDSLFGLQEEIRYICAKCKQIEDKKIILSSLTK